MPEFKLVWPETQPHALSRSESVDVESPLRGASVEDSAARRRSSDRQHPRRLKKVSSLHKVIFSTNIRNNFPLLAPFSPRRCLFWWTIRTSLPFLHKSAPFHGNLIPESSLSMKSRRLFNLRDKVVVEQRLDRFIMCRSLSYSSGR